MSDIPIRPLAGPELDELLKRVPTAALPDNVALKTDIPPTPNLTPYALASDLAPIVAAINALPDFTKFALLSQIPAAQDLSAYALKSQVPVFLPDTYAIAQLMALDPAKYAYQYARCSDLFGVGDVILSDGTNWKPVRPFGVQSQAVGNTTLTTLKNAPTQIFTGAMLANSVVNVSTQYAYRGAKFRVVRTATGTLYNLAVNGLNLALNQWADFEYDGTSFVKTASGGLL